MSVELWNKLPQGFLRKGYGAFSRLDYEVQALITTLAERQKFKCALCDEDRGLIVEHDHWPGHGDGKRLTIYNIRGLVCSRCNWHLGIYEADERGDDRGWENAECCISRDEYDFYSFEYECRVDALLDALRRETMDPVNYGRRKTLLEKFDDWHEYGGDYPWYWGFEEIKEKRHGTIRTPRQYLKTLVACMKFIVEEIEKNPAEPSDEILRLYVRLEPVLDGIRPFVESRMKLIKEPRGTA